MECRLCHRTGAGACGAAGPALRPAAAQSARTCRTEMRAGPARSAARQTAAPSPLAPKRASECSAEF
eukprot:3538818-Rhodomonas_salina.5